MAEVGFDPALTPHPEALPCTSWSEHRLWLIHVQLLLRLPCPRCAASRGAVTADFSL